MFSDVKEEILKKKRICVAPFSGPVLDESRTDGYETSQGDLKDVD